MAKNDDLERRPDDVRADLDEDEVTEAGGKKKLIIIIAAALVVLLAGGGAGAYLFLGHKKPPEKPVAAKSDVPVEPVPILVEVPHVMAPLTKNGDIVAYVYLDLKIEVADEMTKQTVSDNLPRLRDAFVRDLNGSSNADPNNPDRADIQAIQARLLQDARQVFGEDVIKQVYVQHVSYTGA